ncbi:sugar ABC transporter ATP-binding protein [Mesorhizobium sp. B3-1-6]|uniref:ATP-binding cassette domain-containing protein n=1 Tax=Mesorhizobium sp. B3-1-6 TaxID=2589895 RepID=UPI00112E4ECA|nr:sugar ABC transporter ATP-binding protein [Mesorhizobium sp. B3-1-6]TPI44383.1 sugar ABC transporter ATP-binding protein [Mesorhizobium sp. B3-1-6]
MNAEGISIRGITKRYGSTIALDGIDLDILPGEVLGIAGPNGAGKSTLVRIIAGEEKPDAGKLTFDGRPWSPSVDWHAVAVVHQEPQLFPNLTVAENVMVGREGTNSARPRLGSADAKVMDALGIGRLKDRQLADCSLATQQRTEIARAVARDSRVFLFDEPNSALTADESDQLFGEMHALAGTGRIVLLVTHRLGDLVEHCTRVAIVRDGKVRAILSGDALTEDAIARQLVTDAAIVDAVAARRPSGSPTVETLFSVRDWTHSKAFRAISMQGRAGEIIALMGVEGSGSRELIRSFAGLERCTGTMQIEGEASASALRHRTAYVPATRQLSLYSNFSVGENLLVRLGYPEIAGFGLTLKKRKMRDMARDAVRRFLVKTRTTTQGIRSLSGGNQQKVAIAQALHCAPKLLLLEEPTRGVDIHSKAEIYRLLRDYADAGNTVIIFCTEVLEVYEAADLVYVVAAGMLTAPLRVGNYEHVEMLATDITQLEQKRRKEKAAA